MIITDRHETEIQRTYRYDLVDADPVNYYGGMIKPVLATVHVFWFEKIDTDVSPFWVDVTLRGQKLRKDGQPDKRTGGPELFYDGKVEATVLDQFLREHPEHREAVEAARADAI